MKCAMITCSYGENYGNRLQNYALQTVLEQMGHDAHTLSYVPKPYQRKEKKEDTPVTESKPGPEPKKHVIDRKLLNMKKDAFKRFNRMFVNFTYEKYNYKSDLTAIAGKYDFFICGSDQIWNPTFRTWEDGAYFLAFAPEYKRISYAPSIALSEIDPEYHTYMREMTNGIPHLSIRESSGAKIIKDLTGREAEVVLDPTMLLTAQEWDVLTDKADNTLLPDEPYICCYFLGMTDYAKREVERLCEQYNCKKVVMFDEDNPAIFGAGPAEFVSLIKNAKIVCTDSFHGSVFSVIYQRPFVVFPREVTGKTKDMSSRLDTLFETLGIESRIMEEGAPLSFDPAEFDASNAFDRLAELRERSVSYLSQAIQKSMSSPRRKEKNHPGVEESESKYIANVQRQVRADKKDCSGCSACMNICPTRCIQMKEDEEGFCYPVIDMTNCISCHKCEKVCNSTQIVVDKYRGANVSKPGVYAAWAKADPIRTGGSSGGIFTQLALEFVRSGGYVCGAAVQGDMSPKHIITRNEAEVHKMSGSKYIPSDLGTVYRDIKDKLDEGKEVLIGSLPCQISGLYSYLGKEYDNLVTCDLICKGVCSPVVFHKYIDFQQEKEARPIVKVNFKDKGKGWNVSQTRITFKDGYEKVISGKKDLFFRTFTSWKLLRPSCYACKAKGLPRASDLTLADFWGIHKIDPEMNHAPGVSLVLVNSEKGSSMIKKAKDDIECKQFTLNDALMDNPALFNCPEYNPVRTEIFQKLKTEPFANVISQYFPVKAEPAKEQAGKKKTKKRNIFRRIAGKAKRTALGILRKRKI